jgi:hypothetical protein
MLLCRRKEDRECPDAEEEMDAAEAVDETVDTDPRRCVFRDGLDEKLVVFVTPRLVMGREATRFGRGNVTSSMFCSTWSSSKSKMPKSTSLT